VFRSIKPILTIFIPFLLFSVLSNTATGQYNRRSIDELKADTSGWYLIKQSVKAAKNKVEILSVNHSKANEALVQIQVSTHSYMGAIVYNTGGILIDNGWVRLLGSGNDLLHRSLPEWNKGKTFKNYGDKSGYLLIGDDAIGGFFAINAGELGNDVGKVYYLAPETLKWESLGKGYSEFVEFCLNGDLNKFYQNMRWKGWEKDTRQLPGDKTYNFYPYLWTKEGKEIEKNSRKQISIEEQYNFNISTIQSLKH
jgi:hypothetical protein